MTAAFDWLFTRVDYERMARMPYGGELKLDRMRALLDRLGNPQRGLPAVHITGTKGKGSTAAMVAGILTTAGYRTGLFTSPHLERLEERIAIDGRQVTESETTALLECVRPHVETLDHAAAAQAGEQGPTFFEILTAMAFVFFRQQTVNAAVLEVGLGGRLDSTNVCEPLVTAITSISLDHTRQLGDTLAAIAGEKAGIIKPGVPVVSGVSDPEPREVIRRQAASLHAPLLECGADFTCAYCPADSPDGLPTIDVQLLRPERRTLLNGARLSLLGRHQAQNAAIAMMIVEQMRARGWQIDDPAIRGTLETLRWPARVEIVGRRPWVILDAAHNVASVDALVRTLDESFRPRRRVLIFGTSHDKDAAGMLRRLLPAFDETVLTRYTNNPRGMPTEELVAIAQQSDASRWSVAECPEDALNAAWRWAGPDDLICITGSFYLAAELRAQLVLSH